MTKSMIDISSNDGIFYGVGVGPGDPELITLKAARLIQQADVIAYLSNKQNQSQSRKIAQSLLAENVKSQVEIPIIMPMADDPSIGDKVYDQAAVEVQAFLAQGLSVVFLCEGDPLFFGSFAYLLARIQSIDSGRFTCVSVPGISSPHAASSALNLPLTMMKESFSVISGRHDDVVIEKTLRDFDSVIIMKAGRSRPRLLALLEKTQRMSDAHYLEYIGRENERITSDVSALDQHEMGPYFSLFVITKQKSRRL
jgi:precorrin-2/cobalt-factor-2 C20-methyltransferase